tara:strand:+ start:56 stop:655 length:600 start_codon:yes stop_codon:yes gene_type:complete
MKRNLFIILFTPLLIYSQRIETSKILIPPKQIIQINYPLLRNYNLKIWNKSKFDLTISTHNYKTDSIFKKFVMEKGSSTLLRIPNEMYIQFENKYLADLKVEYGFQKGSSIEKNKIKPLTPQRAFYLENNTAQSIPLRIPGVMNPNLSPFSRSGVNLKNGQKIYLNFKGKNILILNVTDSIKHGDRIDIATLINKAFNN